MKYQISFLSEAAEDIEEAFLWYELQQVELGKSFYRSVEFAVQSIVKNPLAAPIVYRSVRRLILTKFPFGLYYKVDEGERRIEVIAILHFKRGTRVIGRRIS